MKKFGLISLFSLLFLIPVLAPAGAALINTDKANEITGNVNITAAQTEYDTTTTLEDRIATVIRIALSLLGSIFIVLMFWAGNSWMQAAGNEEKVKKAKTSIRNLLVGLVLVLMAYALSSGFSTLLAKTLLTK